MQNAKQMAFNHWQSITNGLAMKKRHKGYGEGETADSIWAKLPQASKDYWLERA